MQQFKKKLLLLSCLPNGVKDVLGSKKTVHQSLSQQMLPQFYRRNCDRRHDLRPQHLWKNNTHYVKHLVP